MAYTSILNETRGRVGLITLNRPQALNALNPQLLTELIQALSDYDSDPAIGAMLITAGVWMLLSENTSTASRPQSVE